jgi:hypothetical protein
MPNISVTTANADRLLLLARAWGVSADTALGRLLDDFMSNGAEAPAEVPAEGDGGIAVHAVYGGQRIEGRFFPISGRLEILSGPCSGRSFKSPSGAAIAVVQAVNPTVNPNRNGWSFWIVSDTGRTLQSARAGWRSNAHAWRTP